VWDNWEAILEQSTLLSEEIKEKTFRASIERFIELEYMLHIWIDSMHPTKLPISPSFAIAKSIAYSLSILESNFKASWQWLSHGLQKMFFHGEGTEVNKNDLELLAALEELYEIIVQYDLENVYNMDETGLFSVTFETLTPNDDS
jgi:hypothetical protein